MLISQIDLFIQCAKALLPKHQKSKPQQKRQIETFLKTWLFYNSSSAEVFWTGKTSKSVIEGADPIAEHWYGNLSSAHRIMNPGAFGASFFNQPKPQQLLDVFKFMQWNKTSKAENIRLRPLQRPEVFLNQFQGDPRLIYREAGIELIQEGNDILDELMDFFDYVGDNNEKKTIFDIGMSQSRRLRQFRDSLFLASTNLDLQLLFVQVGKKGCFYRINNDGINNSMASFYKITMTALLKLFKNQDEFSQFLETYNYQVRDNGPYRIANTFDQRYIGCTFSVDLRRGIHPRTIWLWTRMNDERKYKQLMELFEFFEAGFVVYNYNLALRKLGKQKND
jgi:hypothetical protein